MPISPINVPLADGVFVATTIRRVYNSRLAEIGCIQAVCRY
jgi:hypothetical protein